MSKEIEKDLYIQLFCVHGLVRGQKPELGRNADTGGQTKYVLELARALGHMEQVRKVDLFTRFIKDKAFSKDYSSPIEKLDDKVRIVRIQCGGTKYIRKELLWPHLDEFVDKSLIFMKKQDDLPNVVHGHYADGGYVASEISSMLGLPLIFTGHSLGMNKKERLLAAGVTPEEMNRKLHIDHRISVEEHIKKAADLIVTSTQQEIDKQYGMYHSKSGGKFSIIPPGIDLQRFYPYYDEIIAPDGQNELERQATYFMQKELERFLTDANKPLILALSRPDKKKNISGLIEAYGRDKELQAIANLAVFAGIRKDISNMDDSECEVLTELLLFMDKHDLYGKLAIPKRHEFEYEVPALYRIAAAKEGVFVNPAFTEPFGLTLIESAATGLPVVATKDGGPSEIVKRCKNGVLVHVDNHKEMAREIKKILVDKTLWKEYSSNGIQGVRANYSWHAHCTNYLNEISELKIKVSDQLLEKNEKIHIGARLLKLHHMLATDIDDTLLGDDKALEELNNLLNERKDKLIFGVATGRALESARSILQENNVREPDFIISSVGSEIYYGPDFQQDKGWRSHIAVRWQRARIQRLLSKLDFLELQEEETQSAYKLSYYLENIDERLTRVHQVLTENRVQYTIIYSRNQFLDILPARASKGKAIRYLCYKWNFPYDNVIVAGDSGNDEEMLRGSTLGIVVANHSEDLETLRGRKKVYFSKGECAAGILDGIRHYNFLKQK
jgi:sucrose-phosphate synthase